MVALACAAEVMDDYVPIRPAVKLVVIERNPRSMNHMDPETKAVHLRLEAWGIWAKDVGMQAWPAATLLARVIEQGASGASQSGQPPISMPDEIAVIDTAVARLGEIDRKVIKAYYLRWEPVDCMARHVHMRVRMFQNVLKRARWRISGFILAAESQRA